MLSFGLPSSALQQGLVFPVFLSERTHPSGQFLHSPDYLLHLPESILSSPFYFAHYGQNDLFRRSLKSSSYFSEVQNPLIPSIASSDKAQSLQQARGPPPGHPASLVTPLIPPGLMLAFSQYDPHRRAIWWTCFLSPSPSSSAFRCQFKPHFPKRTFADLLRRGAVSAFPAVCTWPLKPVSQE